MKRWIILSIGLISSSVFAAPGWVFNKDDVIQLHSKPADKRLAYGAAPLQFGELRLPKGPGPYPVAVIVHGGCWLAAVAGMNMTSPLADALRDEGIATWNIEYRQVDVPGGGFPGTFQDVGTATDYLRQIAPHYQLDLNRVVVVGHSAGGHLALWLAARSKLSPNEVLYTQNPLKLKGVVALGGVPDLKSVRDPVKGVCGGDVIGQLLGSSTDAILAKRYLQTSPIDLLPLHIPQILIYGKNDPVVPIVLGQAYAAAAQKKGERVQVIEIPGAAHQEPIVPNSIAWPAVRDAVVKLLSPLPDQLKSA